MPQPISERSRLLGLLARRAEQQAARRHPYRRVAWPVLEAAIFIDAAKERRAIPARPASPADPAGVPTWAIGLASRAEMGLGQRGNAHGARRRLRDLLAIGRALAAWNGGLRFEEIQAILGMAEQRLYRLLGWARAEYVLVDLGERGWFLPEQARAIEQRREAA